MRTLIVDDEPLARDALAGILAANALVDRLDLANNALEAQERLSNQAYDVMLLDINMPELSGIDLLDRLRQSGREMPAVVFVTGYAQYAVAAFERHAVDYVLKPFSEERVNEALEFAFRRATSDRVAKLLEVMPQLRELTPKYSSKIGIKSKGRILFIDPRNVVVVQAEGNYVVLQRESGSDLLRESISTVAEKLKPYGFIRIHRSVLVNASFVQDIRPCSTGEFLLRLLGGKEYTVTRTYKENLASLAGSWIGTGSFLRSDCASVAEAKQLQGTQDECLFGAG